MATLRDATAAVFLSYRRGPGASEAAGRLHDRLQSRYGETAVFMDVDTVRPGIDFVDAIQKAVDSSSALIAIVDPNWAVDAEGRNRIAEASDYGRLEVGTALRRGVRVIPVLVLGAEMPAADALPPDLQPLTRRQAVVLSHERFATDVLPLERELDEVLATQTPPAEESQTPGQVEAHPSTATVPQPAALSTTRRSRNWGVGAIAAVLTLIAIAVAVFVTRGDSDLPLQGDAFVIEEWHRVGDLVQATVRNLGDAPASTTFSCDVVTPDGARLPFGIEFVNVPPGESATGEQGVPPDTDVPDCWLP